MLLVLYTLHALYVLKGNIIKGKSLRSLTKVALNFFIVQVLDIY